MVEVIEGEATTLTQSDQEKLREAKERNEYRRGKRKEKPKTRAEKMAEMLPAVYVPPKHTGKVSYRAHNKYDPVYCDTVINMGRKGRSKTQMAAYLKIHRDTLYEWCKRHPEFNEAMRMAMVYAQAWWEMKGQKGMGMKSADFNSRLWEKNMAARFPHDYRERQELAIGAAPDLPELKQTLTLKPDEAYLKMITNKDAT